MFYGNAPANSCYKNLGKFPAFGLDTERYSVRIQSKCSKMLTRKTVNTDTFHAVLPSLLFLRYIFLTLLNIYDLIMPLTIEG